MNSVIPQGHATIYAQTKTPLGNGAFTADGRLVVSHHPMYATPHRVSVFEKNGELSPFPNLAWNTPRPADDRWLDAVLGLHDDTQGRIWLMDMGTRSHVQPKMVVWDTRKDELWAVIPLPWDALTPFSEPNDFVVDAVRGKIYIADEGAGGGGDGSRAALIVVDIDSGATVRRLEGYRGICAEPHSLFIGGQEILRTNPDGSTSPLRVGADGIAMDRAGQWLYVSPLNGRTLWRLPIVDLLDSNLDDSHLITRLEPFSAKPNSGGMWIDANGDLYMTEIEGNAIGLISAVDRSYQQWLVREDMFWPDGLMQGPDGALYVVVTQLPRSPPLANGGEGPHLPFKVFRFHTASALAGQESPS